MGLAVAELLMDIEDRFGIELDVPSLAELKKVETCGHIHQWLVYELRESGKLNEGTSHEDSLWTQRKAWDLLQQMIATAVDTPMWKTWDLIKGKT